MLIVAGQNDSAEGRYVEICDPICEVCGGYKALTICVIDDDNSDGRNTWDWNGLDWTALERLRQRCCVWVDSWWQDRRIVSYLSVPYHTVPYQLSAPG
jgi:hypothetical protein